MGFKEIYLLGCDFNSFAAQTENHCYDKKNDIISRRISLADELKFYALVAYHHYALQKLALKMNVRIVNLTENSLLDAYPKDQLKK
jgi:hypothetical protein